MLIVVVRLIAQYCLLSEEEAALLLASNDEIWKMLKNEKKSVTSDHPVPKSMLHWIGQGSKWGVWAVALRCLQHWSANILVRDSRK